MKGSSSTLSRVDAKSNSVASLKYSGGSSLFHGKINFSIQKAAAKDLKNREIEIKSAPEPDFEQIQKKRNEVRTKYFAENMVKIIVPISAAMLFTVLMMTWIKTRTIDTQMKSWVILYPEAENFSQVAATVVFFLAVIAASTFFMLFVVYCQCIGLAYCFLVLSIFLTLAVMTMFYLHTVLWALIIPMDFITVGIFLYNYTVLGMLAIFSKSPVFFTQAYTVINCSLVALSFIDTVKNEYVMWGILAALVLWDIFAVLAPCGPLKLLVRLIRKRKYNAHVPGLLYKTMIYMAGTENGNPKSHHSSDVTTVDLSSPSTTIVEEGGSSQPLTPEQVEARKIAAEEEDRSVYLGLGDFIFFSMLVGKVAAVAVRSTSSSVHLVDWNLVVACYIAILMGLLLTVGALLVFGKEMPALPFSIIFGLIFYFATTFLVSPFFDTISSLQIFV